MNTNIYNDYNCWKSKIIKYPQTSVERGKINFNDKKICKTGHRQYCWKTINVDNENHLLWKVESITPWILGKNIKKKINLNNYEIYYF